MTPLDQLQTKRHAKAKRRRQSQAQIKTALDAWVAATGGQLTE
jgi:hypothetical protein